VFSALGQQFCIGNLSKKSAPEEKSCEAAIGWTRVFGFEKSYSAFLAALAASAVAT
jgi:hypothetical protein